MKAFHERLCTDFQDTCRSIIELIENKCLPLCKHNTESQAFFHSLIADFYRYQVESVPNLAEEEANHEALDAQSAAQLLTLIRRAKKQRADYTGGADRAYKAALRLAISDLWPVNPVRLAIVLNYTVHLQECMEQVDDAIYLAEATLEAAYTWIDDQPAGSDGAAITSETYTQLAEIKDNLEQWYESAERGPREDGVLADIAGSGGVS